MSIKRKDDGYNYYQTITLEGIQDVPKSKPDKKEKLKELYSYEGPVKQWGKVKIENFKAKTMAVSPAQAKNNILCSAKNKLGLRIGSGGFTLVNEVKKEETEG